MAGERPRAASDQDQDHDWVVRVRRGDPVALEEMFAAYAPRLCAYAHRWTRSRETAEEIVQDVFLAVWRIRDHWTIQSGRLGAYLFRATRNRITNDRRRARLALLFSERATHEEFEGAMARPTAPPDEAVRLAELRRSVGEAVAALPDRCREVFLLNREQGLTYAEIAQLHGVSVKTVEYHMARAFAALRARLAEWSPSSA